MHRIDQGLFSYVLSFPFRLRPPLSIPHFPLFTLSLLRQRRCTSFTLAGDAPAVIQLETIQ